MNENVSIEDLKVLSEETRLKILILINEKGELGLNEISNMTKRAKSTVSEHLKILLDRGFIERIRFEKGYYYRLTDKGKRVLENIGRSGEIPKISGGMFKSKFHVKSMKIEIITPLITGASMIFLSGIPRISILLSIMNGLIFGILNLELRDILRGGIIFAFLTSIIAAIEMGIIEMLITFVVSIVIYMSIGGLTCITSKLIMKWMRGR